MQKISKEGILFSALAEETKIPLQHDIHILRNRNVAKTLLNTEKARTF